MKKKEEILLVLAIALALTLLIPPLISAQTRVTLLNVPNSAPVLIYDIPNQSWPSGENKTFAFNLDEYFFDSEDELIYTYTPVENVTVVIDSENNVSFYPDFYFQGVRNLTFNASDGQTSSLSNLVFLFIGNDTISPLWFNPRRNPESATQNSYVNFSVDWTDNIALSTYKLYVDQGAGWQEYDGTITGKSNTTRTTVQISAPAGSIISWKERAYDTTGNYNETTTQNFTVQTTQNGTNGTGPTATANQTVPPTTRREAFGGAAQRQLKPEVKEEGFSVVPDKILVEIRQGDRITKFIKITNNQKEDEFDIFTRKEDQKINVTKPFTKIDQDESEAIAIEVIAAQNTPPDYYENEIVVKSGEVYKTIPFIILVKEREINFKLTLLTDSLNKFAGDLMKFNLTLINLASSQDKNIKLIYAIKNLNSEDITTNNEEVILKDKLDLQRELEIPITTRPGEYILYARAENDKKIDHAALIFTVDEKKSLASFLKINYLFILLLLLFLITATLLIKYRRDKQKARLLQLYVYIHEMRENIEKNHLEEAISIYKKIRLIYGEPLTSEEINAKETLKEQMISLINPSNLNKKAEENQTIIQPEIKKEETAQK